MKPRRLKLVCLLLAVLAGLAAWLEPTQVVWGWLRGEAFYQGRPTSYWAERIRPWQLPNQLLARTSKAESAQPTLHPEPLGLLSKSAEGTLSEVRAEPFEALARTK